MKKVNPLEKFIKSMEGGNTKESKPAPAAVTNKQAPVATTSGNHRRPWEVHPGATPVQVGKKFIYNVPDKILAAGTNVQMHKMTIKHLMLDHTKDVYQCAKCMIGVLRPGYVPLRSACQGCAKREIEGKGPKRLDGTIPWIVGKPV